jgi:hypothetical protein
MSPKEKETIWRNVCEILNGNRINPCSIDIKICLRQFKEKRNIRFRHARGPGQLLGYRAMQRKIREQHQLPVPRIINLVYDVMTMVDPAGLERRGHVGKKKIRRGGTGTFTLLVSAIDYTLV